jgi:hypothetical protein
VMKDTSYAVIERIEFDLPWQWPPASVQPFMKDGKLDDDSIAVGVQSLAQRAWRRPLTAGGNKELNALISETLKNSESKIDALRDLLMAVLADTRFLFYSDVEQTQKMQCPPCRIPVAKRSRPTALRSCFPRPPDHGYRAECRSPAHAGRSPFRTLYC